MDWLLKVIAILRIFCFIYIFFVLIRDDFEMALKNAIADIKKETKNVKKGEKFLIILSRILFGKDEDDE